jgi:hypothetical protein
VPLELAVQGAGACAPWFYLLTHSLVAVVDMRSLFAHAPCPVMVLAGARTPRCSVHCAPRDFGGVQLQVSQRHQGHNVRERAQHEVMGNIGCCGCGWVGVCVWGGGGIGYIRS